MDQRFMIMRALEAVACLMLLVVLIMLSGCASERIVYRNINVAVPVYPDVPDWALESYSGALPVASPDGSVCFADGEIKNLQDWMKWHSVRVKQLQEIMR